MPLESLLRRSKQSKVKWSLAPRLHELARTPPPPPMSAAHEDGDATYLSMDSPSPPPPPLPCDMPSSPESAYSVAATTLPHFGQLRASNLYRTLMGMNKKY